MGMQYTICQQATNRFRPSELTKYYPRCPLTIRLEPHGSSLVSTLTFSMKLPHLGQLLKARILCALVSVRARVVKGFLSSSAHIIITTCSYNCKTIEYYQSIL